VQHPAKAAATTAHSGEDDPETEEDEGSDEEKGAHSSGNLPTRAAPWRRARAKRVRAVTDPHRSASRPRQRRGGIAPAPAAAARRHRARGTGAAASRPRRRRGDSRR
jgi:hypothetical protein